MMEENNIFVMKVIKGNECFYKLMYASEEVGYEEMKCKGLNNTK